MPYYPAAVLAPTIPQNFIPTNRVHSEFFLHGGPRLPLSLREVTGLNPAEIFLPYDDNITYTVKRTPLFAGQLYWSTATPQAGGGYVINRSKGSLYIAVEEQTLLDGINYYPELVWKPVVPSHFDLYIDPSTGDTWDPVGLYTCNPPYLCPG